MLGEANLVATSLRETEIGNAVFNRGVFSRAVFNRHGAGPSVVGKG